MTQPTTERRTRVRTHGPACTADQCQQGRTACPCPQACELPGTEADPLHDEPISPMEAAFLTLAFTAFASGLALLLHVCAGA